MVRSGTAAVDPLDDFTKYHLGCGPILIPGYLNIDRFSDLEPNRLYANFRGRQDTHLLNFDLSLGIPGRPGRLDVIYHCHFLEHFSRAAGIELLRQAHLLLRPGGTMRVVVPDLQLWIEKYHSGDNHFFDAYRRQILGDNRNTFRTKASVFMAMLTGFGHQWAYDFETLNWILEELGFVAIRRTLFQESRLAEIKLMEPYSPLRGMESLCVECEKPE